MSFEGQLCGCKCGLPIFCRWCWRRKRLGWIFVIRLVIELGLKSRLEGLLDGKGEVEEREGEEKEADDSDDTRESKTVDQQIPPMNYDNRIVPSVLQTDTIFSRSSLPMITAFLRFHHYYHLNSNYRWHFARPLNFNISYLVKISRYSWAPSIFEISGPWSSFSNKVSATRA